MPEQPTTTEPLRWTAHRGAQEGPPERRWNLYYTAPGAWLILYDDERRRVAGTPWKLVRHGQLVEWCHTLRIAKHTANRLTTAENTGARP